MIRGFWSFFWAFTTAALSVVFLGGLAQAATDGPTPDPTAASNPAASTVTAVMDGNQFDLVVAALVLILFVGAAILGAQLRRGD